MNPVQSFNESAILAPACCLTGFQANVAGLRVRIHFAAREAAWGLSLVLSMLPSFSSVVSVIAPSFRRTTGIIPDAESEARTLQTELLNEKIAQTMVLPQELETVMPSALVPESSSTCLLAAASILLIRQSRPASWSHYFSKD